MHSTGRRLAVLVLGLVQLAQIGAAQAQEATPGPGEATIQPLFSVTLPEDWIPTGTTSVIWYRGSGTLGLEWPFRPAPTPSVSTPRPCSPTLPPWA